MVTSPDSARNVKNDGAGVESGKYVEERRRNLTTRMWGIARARRIRDPRRLEHQTDISSLGLQGPGIHSDNAACSFPTFVGGCRLMANLPAVATSDVYSEPGPLSSTGITRRHRYYGPLRHPKRPDLSLAGVRLEFTRFHRWGFPCCIGSPCTVMPSSLPRRNCWKIVVR